jgi:fructosamine-3-kinase
VELTGDLRNALRRSLGAAPQSARRLSGGDINDAFEVRLADARSIFVKTNAHAAPAMFPAEARGLAWLAEARALRIPEVLAVSTEHDAVHFLALELVRAGNPALGHDESLGRGLAALHRFGAPGFGLDHDNFIGSLPQSNRRRGSWSEFYALERLAPQLARAVERGRASQVMRRGFERLYARLPELTGPEEPPARLHGDLWGGNLHTDENGAPCLIDPAAYGGHREMDLAMMRLFGGFGERVFSAYAEAFPLAPGAAERVPLFQLYPLMVHVNLFGGGYARSVEGILAKYA